MKIIKNALLDTWEMAESEGPIQSPPGGGKPANGKRILIVDDDLKTRELFQKFLERKLPQYEYDTATNGAEAVKCFLAHHHHVILLDMIMPVMDGEEAFFAISDHCDEQGWEAPRVIFCSGHSPSVGVRNAVASDAAHCLLQKPVRQQTLFKAVSKRARPVS